MEDESEEVLVSRRHMTSGRCCRSKSLHERRKREFPTPLQFQDINFIGRGVEGSDLAEERNFPGLILRSTVIANLNFVLGPAKQKKNPEVRQELGVLRLS